MARKTTETTITADGRDKGKTFILTEMDAYAAEEWAMRAILALTRSGLEIPADIAQQGMAGLAAMGVQAFAGVNYFDIKPLLDEMLNCVQIKEDKITRKPTRADIEEVATLLQLRKEVFALHVDFSKLAALSTSGTQGTAGDQS